MKLTIERSALLKGLSHVQSVVERRQTVAVLSNVLLEADGTTLSLTATDMDIAIVERVEAVVEAPGALTAPAHMLHDIVRKLPDGAQISLEAAGEQDSQLVLRAGRSRFSLQTLPKEDFPQMSGGDMPHSFTLTSADTRHLLDHTRFAISTEETRYYLNGVYLHVPAAPEGAAPRMRCVATDGHRLARVEIPAPEGAKNAPGVIIPRKAVAELRKLIDESDHDILVDLSKNKIRCTFGPAILTSKLIDGAFPDYERVIPTANDKTLRLDIRAFAEAVDRVSTIATEKMRAIKVSIGGGLATLSASDREQGTAEEEISVEYDGPEMEIGFNARYLMDIATQIASGGAEFVMSDPASPTIIRDKEDDSALYVLMPMRV